MAKKPKPTLAIFPIDVQIYNDREAAARFMAQLMRDNTQFAVSYDQQNVQISYQTGPTSKE